MTGLVHRLGAAALLLLGYTLDANGHRTAEVWERPGERVETRYGLDLAERLTSIEVDGRRVVYTLDAVGNRTAESSAEGERIHSYDERNRLVETRLGGVVEASYGYDAAGRQLSVQRGAQSRTYVYDAEDRLLAVSASGAAPIRYAVDGFGQRRERESGGQVERYQWDGTRLASISNALGNRLADYQHAYGWPISVREGNERRSALADVHGTIQLLTDDTGAIAGHTRTDVWGEVKAQGGEQTRLGHTGYLLDPGITDEQYAQARQYAPGLGRFTSVDPWAGDTLRPITLNKYLYGNGNPGSYLDPTGMAAETQYQEAMTYALEAWKQGNLTQLGQLGEIRLEWLLEKSGQVIVKGPINNPGQHNADIVAFDPETKQLSFFDNKVQTAKSTVSWSDAVGADEGRKRAIAQATELLERLRLDPELAAEIGTALGAAESDPRKANWVIANANPSESGVANMAERISVRLAERGVRMADIADDVRVRSLVDSVRGARGSKQFLKKLGSALPVLGVAVSVSRMNDAYAEDLAHQQFVREFGGEAEYPWLSSQREAAVIAGEEGGATSIGAGGAYLGGYCGPLAWVCVPAGGLIGGLVGDFAGGDIAAWQFDQSMQLDEEQSAQLMRRIRDRIAQQAKAEIIVEDPSEP